MQLEVQSALVGAFVTIAVMTGLLLRRRRRRTDALFAMLCGLLVAWFGSVFLAGYYGSAPIRRVELAVASLIPAAVIRLFADLVPWHTHRGRRLMNTAYTMSGLLAVASLSPLGDFEIFQIVVAVYLLATILTASRLMTDSDDVGRQTIEHARRRYLAIGASLVTVLAIGGEIPAFGDETAAVGHLAVMTYVFFLSQVIDRDRLLDLNEFVGRMLILGILAVLFAAISALLVSLGDNTSTRLFGAVVGVIILLTLYEPLKDRLESKAIELFFRERHRFTETLDDLRRRMQHGILDPEQMSSIVVDALFDSRRATHVAVYLLEPLGNGFTLQASRGPDPTPRVNANELPVLWKTIQQNRSPLLAETVEDRDLAEAVRAVSADVVLPFVSGEAVLGFLAVRDDRVAEPFSTSELAQLMRIGETAATVIWNSRLAERLRERERLAALGAMAAGLAHEIRNPLGAIKGAAEYLGPEGLQREEDAEFLDVIVEETNRLDSVVSQFLNYARPFRAKMRMSDLNEIIRKTAVIIEAQSTEDSPPLVLELDDGLPEVSMDGEQIKQVLLNLVLNGMDAAPDTPMKIVTRLRADLGSVEFCVEDQGPGIPAEDLKSVFIPFFTTKQRGTGLGLAVCDRIVTQHGGTISVRSSDEGTTFIIQLPLERKDFASTTGNYTQPRKARRRSTSFAEPIPDGSR